MAIVAEFPRDPQDGEPQNAPSGPVWSAWSLIQAMRPEVRAKVMADQQARKEENDKAYLRRELMYLLEEFGTAVVHDALAKVERTMLLSPGMGSDPRR